MSKGSSIPAALIAQHLQFIADNEHITLDPAAADADRIAEIAALVAARVPDVAAVMSVAPSLEAARFAALFERYPALGVWFDGIGGILDGATLAIGQAGTANEAAAASGVPVVALELAGDRRSGWYRMRQERLLGDAMAGDGALFTRQDAIEAAWTVVDPVLKNHHRVRTYKRRTWGPKEADALIAGGSWHNPNPKAPTGC